MPERAFTRPQMLFVVVFSAVVVALLAWLMISQMRIGVDHSPWSQQTFWVLHKAGTLRVGDSARPPAEAPPPGDQWVRAAPLRCEACQAEFVGYHMRLPQDRRTDPKAPDPAGGMAEVARPGGPWHVEDAEQAGAIVSVACPKCKAAGDSLRTIGPEEAKTLAGRGAP